MSLNFATIFFLCLLLVSCSENKINENKSLEVVVKPPLQSVTDEVCPVLEDDIFTLKNKNSFTECEVRKSSNLFNGKVLRIKSRYSLSKHGAYLSDAESCSGLSNSIDDAISIRMTETNYNLIHKTKKIPISIEAVGKFVVSTPSQQSDTIDDRTPYHFEIDCLEKVEGVVK